MWNVRSPGRDGGMIADNTRLTISCPVTMQKIVVDLCITKIVGPLICLNSFIFYFLGGNSIQNAKNKQNAARAYRKRVSQKCKGLQHEQKHNLGMICHDLD